MKVTKRIVAAAVLLVSILYGASTFAGFCDPLPQPAPSDPQETITTEEQLRNRAFNAPSGTTLFISPGVYSMTNFLQIKP